MMRNLKGILIAAVLLVPSVSYAQTTAHPCDTAPSSITSVFTGQIFELGWCHDGKDAEGNNLPGTLVWKLQRDNTVLTNLTITKSTTANAAGAFYYSVRRAETNIGTFTFKVSGSVTVTSQAGNVVLESGVVSFPTTLKVSNPGPAPAVPSKPRVR